MYAAGIRPRVGHRFFSVTSRAFFAQQRLLNKTGVTRLNTTVTAFKIEVLIATFHGGAELKRARPGDHGLLGLP